MFDLNVRHRYAAALASRQAEPSGEEKYAGAGKRLPPDEEAAFRVGALVLLEGVSAGLGVGDRGLDLVAGLAQSRPCVRQDGPGRSAVVLGRRKGQ